jgi:hypothetical protein
LIGFSSFVFVTGGFFSYLRYQASTQSNTLAIVNLADSYYAPTDFTAVCIRLVLVAQITFSKGLNVIPFR